MSDKIECYHEIQTQATAWQEAVRETLHKRNEIEAFFTAAEATELFFIGCTSPYYAGLAASAFWRMETGVPARAIPSSELVLFPSLYYPASDGKPVLIALSRSGKTTETIWAMGEFEKRYPGRSVLIGCNPEGALVDMASLNVLLPESAEKTIAQTRSLAAMFISALIMGCIHSGNRQALEYLQQSPERAPVILKNSEMTIKSLFESHHYENIFFLGGGPLYGIALESGLKCMEMSGTDTFSYQFLESRHGPRSLIDENTLVVGFYSRAGSRYEAQVMEELSVRHKATTLAVTPTRGWDTGQVSAAVSIDCDWPDGFVGLGYLPIGQLVAYYAAISKGLNPDLARLHSSYVEIQRY